MITIPSKTLALAALAGLVGSAVIGINQSYAGTHDGGGTIEKQGQPSEKEKHACKGLNSCAGNGGDGKNACKGQGSCATDGSKPKQ